MLRSNSAAKATFLSFPQARSRPMACSANYSLNRSEEHTSELQSLTNLVCRLLLPPRSTLFPYTTLFRSDAALHETDISHGHSSGIGHHRLLPSRRQSDDPCCDRILPRRRHSCRFHKLGVDRWHVRRITR